MRIDERAPILRTLQPGSPALAHWLGREFYRGEQAIEKPREPPEREFLAMPPKVDYMVTNTVPTENGALLIGHGRRRDGDLASSCESMQHGDNTLTPTLLRN